MSFENESSIEKDRREVEEMNRRILQKDSMDKRSASSIVAQAESDIKNLSEEKKQSLIPELREYSRQVYLGKRKDQQLELLEKEIQDEEYIFDDDEITEQEKMELERKKVWFCNLLDFQQILEMTKKRDHIDDNDEVYEMPKYKKVLFI